MLRRAFTCYMGDRWGAIKRDLAARRDDPPSVGDIFILAVDADKPRLVVLTGVPSASRRFWSAMEVHSADANVLGGLLVVEPEPCAGVVIETEAFDIDPITLKLRVGRVSTKTIEDAILRGSS